MTTPGPIPPPAPRVERRDAGQAVRDVVPIRGRSRETRI